MKNPEPAAGERHNRLILVRYDHTGKHYRRNFLFRCDCGTEVVRSIEAVRSGNTKSCGCLSVEKKLAKRLPEDHGPITAVLLQYKRHAKDRGIVFELTRADLENLVRQACIYCGHEARNLKKTKNCPEGFAHNGIDRKDNARGYVAGNVVPCCGICNRAKGTQTFEDFINWAKDIAKKWG